MKRKLFVLLFAIGLLSSCDNSSYDMMTEIGVENKLNSDLNGLQTRSSSSMQEYSMKNLQALAGHQIRISLNTTAISDIYLTKKPQSSGSAPWVTSKREPDSGNVEEQYWMLIATNYIYDGKPAFAIKSVTCDKILSKNNNGSSNGQTSVKFPIGNKIYDIYDKRDLWLFEYDDDARSYLLINAESPSLCLVRQTGADASNPLQLIPKGQILYHQAHWNLSSVETFELVSIKYISTDADIVVQDFSRTDVLYTNTSSSPFEYEQMYEKTITNTTSSTWSKEFTIKNGVTIAIPAFSKNNGKIEVSTSIENKWVTGGSSESKEDVKFSVKISQTVPAYNFLKATMTAIEYIGTVRYEAVVRSSKGKTTIYGKWEGVTHQDINIILSDKYSSTPVDENDISVQYTRR